MYHAYYAIFEYEDNVFKVRFPDIEFISTFGTSFKEAKVMAQEALYEYLMTFEFRRMFPKRSEYHDLVDALGYDETLVLIEVFID